MLQIPVAQQVLGVNSDEELEEWRLLVDEYVYETASLGYEHASISRL